MSPDKHPATLAELRLELEREFQRLHAEFRLIGGSLAELHDKIDDLAERCPEPG